MHCDWERHWQGRQTEKPDTRHNMLTQETYSGALAELRKGMVEDIKTMMRLNNLGMVSLFENGMTSDFDFGTPYVLLLNPKDAYADNPVGVEIVAVAVIDNELLVVPNLDSLTDEVVDILEQDRYFTPDQVNPIVKYHAVDVDKTLYPTDTLLTLQGVIESVIKNLE